MNSGCSVSVQFILLLLTLYDCGIYLRDSTICCVLIRYDNLLMQENFVSFCLFVCVYLRTFILIFIHIFRKIIKYNFYMYLIHTSKFKTKINFIIFKLDKIIIVIIN